MGHINIDYRPQVGINRAFVPIDGLKKGKSPNKFSTSGDIRCLQLALIDCKIRVFSQKTYWEGEIVSAVESVFTESIENVFCNLSFNCGLEPGKVVRLAMS
jgi:hypothetical protein